MARKAKKADKVKKVDKVEKVEASVPEIVEEVKEYEPSPMEPEMILEEVSVVGPGEHPEATTFKIVESGSGPVNIEKTEKGPDAEEPSVDEEADEDEMIVEAAEILEDSPELVADEVVEVEEEPIAADETGINPDTNEPWVEVKIDPIVAKTPKVEKQQGMFYNLEEGMINLEEQEREKVAVIKAKELEAEELKKIAKEGEPYLTCSFCKNVQYELNSRDATTPWCKKCGRAFHANWKY